MIQEWKCGVPKTWKYLSRQVIFARAFHFELCLSAVVMSTSSHIETILFGDSDRCHSIFHFQFLWRHHIAGLLATKSPLPSNNDSQ